MDLKSFEIILKKSPKTPQPDLQHRQGLQRQSLLLSPHAPIPRFQAPQCRGTSQSSRAERRISPAFTSPDGQSGEPRSSSASTPPPCSSWTHALCQLPLPAQAAPKPAHFSFWTARSLATHFFLFFYQHYWWNIETLPPTTTIQLPFSHH